ncbi:MAG TPA: methyltransferase domain-containing protein, partial [Herpetosiphonaceae bacterium]|nr:methyltransferase domain-containing protein [Herpetosiphonaceae bacterium]
MKSPAPVDEGSDVAKLHQALVDKLTHGQPGAPGGLIRTPRVEAAFRAVPRHLFLPDVAPEQVYRDEAISTKQQDGVSISASSQPAIMAIMLEQLGLEPGQRVLEIGAGTGYNAALMAHIVGDAGQVVTIDIDDDIVENARAHLATAGFGQVQVVCADGALGYPEAAPYDRIILTVGASDIAPAWWEQLKPGGRLVLPLAIHGMQASVAFEHAGGYLQSLSLSPCGFMMLRGSFAAPQTIVRLGPEPGLSITVDNPDAVDAAAVYGWLTGP